MNILVLTQHFPPEKGAAQNRLYELAVFLGNNKHTVHVHTAFPHYPEMQIYRGFAGKLWSDEGVQGVFTLSRSYIYVSKSRTIFSRILNYFSFVFSSIFFSFKFINTKFDFVIVESPPLFLAITALYYKWFFKAKLISNISDLWPESAEKMGVIKNKLLLGIASTLEAKLYNSSILLLGQTKGICNSIINRFPTAKILWMPNGADFQAIDTVQPNIEFRKKYHLKATDFVVFYGGLLGLAYDFITLLSTIKLLKEYTDIVFIIAGDGPQKDMILKFKNEHQLPALILLDMMQRDALIGIIKSIDCSVIPMFNASFFEGTIPTKIFDVLACQKPIILGLNGEAKELFIDKAEAGLYYTPENGNELKAAILELYHSKQMCEAYGRSGFEYVKSNFDRQVIMQQLLPYLC